MSGDLWFLDDIRDAINSPDTADPELLREASVAYNDACRDANVRLREVNRLLQRGLRNEAIQAAEQEPTLLDLVAELDFPTCEEWQGMLAQWGMQLPPALERDIAARLNTAYAELQPLEQLMRQHRLLALARAPLTARIEVLRRITAKDDMNLSWKSDLAAYERQRIQKIRAEAADAGRREDLAGLSALRDELGSASWQCEVPHDVVQEVEDLYRGLSVAEARKSLQQLVPQLYQAHSELDIVRATRLADQWHELAVTAGVESADPLRQQVAEALQWVHDERRAASERCNFRESLLNVEEALDDYKPLAELDVLFQKAERFGMPIPELLRNRVAERLEALRGNARRRSVLIGVVSTVAIVVLAAGVVYFWWTVQQRGMISSHVQHLQQLVDQEQWEPASSYITQLPSPVQQAPEVVALRTRVAQGMKDESERLEQVGRLLDQAEAMDVDAPDHQLLTQLDGLTKSAEEKQRLAEVRLQVRRRANEQQQSIDKAYLDTISTWSKKLADLERQESLDGIDLWGMLSQLQLDLNQHSQATADLRSRSVALTRRLRAIIDQRDKAEKEQAALQSVFNNIGRPSRYVAALQRLVDDQPDTTAASHARQLLDDRKAWMSVVEWAEFWESHRPGWNDLSPSKASEVLDEGEALQADSPKNELSGDFEDRKVYLHAIVGRNDVDLAKLKSLLVQNSLVSGVWLVVDIDGKRVYCPKEPTEDLSRSTLHYDYFTDYASTASRTRRLQFLRQFDGKPYILSPQAECAQYFARRLDALSDANWDNTFGALAFHVRQQIEQDPALDEVLALDMLRNIVNAGSDGSFLFAETFAPVIREIENSGVDLSVAWFLPGDADAETARRDAHAVIAGLPDFKSLIEGNADLRRSRCMAPADKVSWVAALDRTANGSWICRPSLSTSASGTLLVAMTGESGDVELVPVADVISGQVNWHLERNPTAQLVGTPVFLRCAASDNP